MVKLTCSKLLEVYDKDRVANRKANAPPEGRNRGRGVKWRAFFGELV